MAVPPNHKYKVRFKSWLRPSVIVQAQGVDERERFFVFFSLSLDGFSTGALESTDIFAISEVSAIRRLEPVYRDQRNIGGVTHA